MQGEVRVGKYDGSIKDLASKYGTNFLGIHCPQFKEEEIIFLRDKKSEDYILIFSKPISPPPEYNFILRCFYNKSVALENILGAFEDLTKIKTIKAPETLRNSMDKGLNLSKIIKN